MSTAMVTIPNIQIQLTVEQLIDALRQLEPKERAKLVKILTDIELKPQKNTYQVDTPHSIKGKYSFVQTSSTEFAKRKLR